VVSAEHRPDTDVDVTAERTIAQHVAFRLLDQAAAILMTGKPGSVKVPRLDPLQGAVVGAGLNIIAQAVRHDRIPHRFVRRTQHLPASSDTDIKRPGGTSSEASHKEN
jgi:hypothetical protein